MQSKFYSDYVLFSYALKTHIFLCVSSTIFWTRRQNTGAALLLWMKFRNINFNTQVQIVSGFWWCCLIHLQSTCHVTCAKRLIFIFLFTPACALSVLFTVNWLKLWNGAKMLVWRESVFIQKQRKAEIWAYLQLIHMSWKVSSCQMKSAVVDFNVHSNVHEIWAFSKQGYTIQIKLVTAS